MTTPDQTLGCLVRSRFGKGSIELRQDEDGSASELFGHFSKFNVWYEVDSVWEGNFLERVAPGAFAKTIENDGAGMKVLFNHGFDPMMGDKPLGPILELHEDDKGAAYRVGLLDTDYNRGFVIPALEGRLMDGSKAGSQLGASFQFLVPDGGDVWDRAGRVSTVNPRGLPRRTITEARVFEFGPVTFPASSAATAGARSGTDEFIDHLLHDSRFVAELVERSSPHVVKQMLAATDRQAEIAPESEPGEHEKLGSEKLRQLRRRASVILKLGDIR